MNLGRFGMLLTFFRTSWCVGILNSAIFNSFHNRVEFGTILGGLQNFGGGFEHPKPPLGTPLLCGGWNWNFTHLERLKIGLSGCAVCGRSPAEVVGSNSAEGMDVCRECCVLSGRGLCYELITRPEESYRLWCVRCV